MDKNYFDPLVLSKISDMQLRARFVVEGLMSGIHKSRQKGFSVEFEEHREYSPGDDLRHLDWKAFGKFDKFFIKEYREETNLKAHIILDCSSSMDYSSDSVSKFEYGCYVAVSLAYLILKQGDAAGLVTFSDRIENFIPPKAKLGHLNEIIIELEKRKPKGETALGRILKEIASEVKRRGIIIVISDLLDNKEDVIKGLKYFRYKGNDVIVFQVMDKDEIELPFKDLTLFKDMEKELKVLADPEAIRNEYRKAISDFLNWYKDTCMKNQMDYTLLGTHTPVDKALVSYLAWRE